MKLKVITAFILFIISSITFPNQISKYQINGKWIEFVDIEPFKITINKKCIKKGKIEKSPCLAYKALYKLQKLKRKSIPSYEGSTPGRAICQDILGMKASNGYTVKNDENCFCLFPDKSYIDCGTLFYYFIKN